MTAPEECRPPLGGVTATLRRQIVVVTPANVAGWDFYVVVGSSLRLLLDADTAAGLRDQPDRAIWAERDRARAAKGAVTS